MASRDTFNDFATLESGLVLITGFFKTDSSGDILNGVTGEVDQDGDKLLLPRGFSAAAKTGTGAYTLTLSDIWVKLPFINVSPVCTSATAGTIKVKTFNPKGATVNSITRQTVNFIYEVTGSAAAFNSKAFNVCIVAKCTPVGS